MYGYMITEYVNVYKFHICTNIYKKELILENKLKKKV